MLLDTGYLAAAAPHHRPAGPASHADLHENPFQALYLRTALDLHQDDDAGGHDAAPGALDNMEAMDAQLLELDAQMDNKNLFVDAFQYFGQDVDTESSYSSPEEDIKPELVPGGLPHMIPGSRRFAAASPVLAPALETPPASTAAGQPQSILLHTGANVVDMVSGVTCSGVGLGALARFHDRDAVSDLTRSCSSSVDQRSSFGQHQGNFGHLLRQRPASLGGEVCAPPPSHNLHVARQRPRSEDLQGLRVLDGQDYDDEDEDDDDVFLDSGSVFRPAPRARLSSSNSNDSDEDDLRDEAVTECRWSECGLQFAGRAPLVRHIEKVHVEPRRGEDFSCLWRCCPRGARPFNARYKLLIHMRVHSGEKPNKCPVAGCPKAFSRLENLKIHQRSHTGERPYCCQFAGCNKAFSNSSDRAKHQRTHFDTKPYACQVAGCTKRYTDPSSLRKHVKNHSGKDHGHALVRRAGSTGSTASTASTADSEASTGSDLSQSTHSSVSDARPFEETFGDVGLDDALFPSADDIDQAIREFIPFDEVGKMLAEPAGVSGFDLHEPLEFDFDPSFWNCSA